MQPGSKAVHFELLHSRRNAPVPDCRVPLLPNDSHNRAATKDCPFQNRPTSPLIVRPLVFVGICSGMDSKLKDSLSN